ncbi:hypothetical protein BDR05DRAFT_978478 [Suillus weaverae]|nr:hypothetical protein BDR05DRAFT_978478 [Suillus weaverae]
MENGWHCSLVKICLPTEKEKFTSEEEAPEMEIPGVYHCSLTDIIMSVFQDSISCTFHMTPFQQQWKVSEEHKVNVYDADNNLEQVVASLMMWSDATHLASFGDASIWLVYLFFGNQSKYTRGKPTVSTCHHVAYIPTLPDDFQDIYIDIFGEVSSYDNILIFMHAYKYGIVIQCRDGITRRVFPQFFSYSADYPEKILLACIKFLGKYIPKMGTKLDMKRCEATQCAQQLIFRHGVGNGQHIKSILKEESLVSTRFELGVWKAIFTHLMCILVTAGGVTVHKLNLRYDI